MSEKIEFEPPITKEESANSEKIRKALAERKFDDLYKLCPNEIAKKINEKYRIIELK